MHPWNPSFVWGCHCDKMAYAIPGIASSPDNVQPKKRAISALRLFLREAFSRSPQRTSSSASLARHLLGPKLALFRGMGLPELTCSNQNITPAWGWDHHARTGSQLEGGWALTPNTVSVSTDEEWWPAMPAMVTAIAFQIESCRGATPLQGRKLQFRGR